MKWTEANYRQPTYWRCSAADAVDEDDQLPDDNRASRV